MIKQTLLIVLVVVCAVVGYPYNFQTKKYRVGIEYDNSLPMNGGTDRYRHVNNYDPFFVTISATAKKGFVISYLDVTATVDLPGEVDFRLVRGQTGSKTMTFQIVSNHSDFLSYSYLAYGLRDEEFKKVSNIISLPIGNDGHRLQTNGHRFQNGLTIFTLLLNYLLVNLFT